MDTVLEVPQGRFRLNRLPQRKNELLQAWDAADEYLLNYFASELTPELEAHITILNDSFGALALALQSYSPTLISDSYLSQQATRNNFQLNGLNPSKVILLDSLTLPAKPIDYLLIKVPKTLALLEYQLIMLRPLLQPDCQLILSGMLKALPVGVWKLLERLIGGTHTSLAVKKARLLFARLDHSLELPVNPFPVRYVLENNDLQISNHANVFSRESLDIGTRFLLQHLPDNPDYRQCIDLGCGNGVVGIMMAKQHLARSICFIDESFMAIASARENFESAFLGSRQAKFIVGDGLSAFSGPEIDCIVCNPPFHQQHTMGEHISWQMFKQSWQELRKGGELRVIGNRHLPYRQRLQKLFGNCEQVAGNAKFLIYKAIKR